MGEGGSDYLSLSQYTYSRIVYNDNSYNTIATFTKVQGPKKKILDFSVVILDFLNDLSKNKKV